jgi:hypothetical protein
VPGWNATIQHLAEDDAHVQDILALSRFGLCVSNVYIFDYWLAAEFLDAALWLIVGCKSKVSKLDFQSARRYYDVLNLNVPVYELKPMHIPNRRKYLLKHLQSIPLLQVAQNLIPSYFVLISILVNIGG